MAIARCSCHTQLALLAHAADFDYIKTSTGFLGHGAKVEHVRLMAACCDELCKDDSKKMLVKASGGVRSLQDAITMLQAGASRLGTSAGVAIAEQMEVEPPELTTIDAYPSDSWRYHIPPTVDVFLPGKVGFISSRVPDGDGHWLSSMPRLRDVDDAYDCLSFVQKPIRIQT